MRGITRQGSEFLPLAWIFGAFQFSNFSTVSANLCWPICAPRADLKVAPFGPQTLVPRPADFRAKLLRNESAQLSVGHLCCVIVDGLDDARSPASPCQTVDIRKRRHQ